MLSYTVHSKRQFFSTKYLGFCSFSSKRAKAKPELILAAVVVEDTVDLWLLESPDFERNLREFYEIEEGMHNVEILIYAKNNHG